MVAVNLRKLNLNIQKSSVEGTVHFQNLIFPNTEDQMREMRREVQ